jgi:hypothetical protein
MLTSSVNGQRIHSPADLIPLFGAFPSNVYVFDFFHKLVGANYMLPPSYATGIDDSHPNAAATLLVAPQFVNEAFNASIYYETHYSIKQISEIIPNSFSLNQNYPNPFNPFRLKIPATAGLRQI